MVAVAAAAYHRGYLAPPIVEGFSNPLWTLLVGLSRPCSWSPTPMPMARASSWDCSRCCPRRRESSCFEGFAREPARERGLKRWRCVFTDKALNERPTRDERKRLADLAIKHGKTLEGGEQRLTALRLHSLATLLDRGDAHRRRKTEQLRAHIFPRPPGT
ncbi:hypothetical protein WA016_02545 [Myxococcus stipitatus]